MTGSLACPQAMQGEPARTKQQSVSAGVGGQTTTGKTTTTTIFGIKLNW